MDNETDEQQPGTHRRIATITWSEVVTYQQDVEIDVPDAYDGNLGDLIEEDDNAFEAEDGELHEGIPAGFRSHWLERADFATTYSVTDRQVSAVEVPKVRADKLQPGDVIDLEREDLDVGEENVDAVTFELVEVESVNNGWADTAARPGHVILYSTTGLAAPVEAPADMLFEIHHRNRAE